MTAKEIIEAALQEIGVIEAGASPDFYDVAWCLSKFNRMLNSMSADGVNLYYRVEDTLSLSNGVTSYAIGTGATLNTVRPNVIEDAFIRIDNQDYPVAVRPMDEYWNITDKTIPGRPVDLYYNPTYPNGTMYLYYVPDSTYSLHIVSQKPLTSYTDEDTAVSVPIEYEDMLVTGLAVRLAPRYGIAVSRDLALAEKNAYNNVKARNIANDMKPVELYLTGGGRMYNVDAG